MFTCWFLSLLVTYVYPNCLDSFFIIGLGYPSILGV